jgi:[ribosomal protein S5]-alanine N-acetyltransferase
MLTPLLLEDFSIFETTMTDPFVRKYLCDDRILSKDELLDMMRQNHQTWMNASYGLFKVVTINTLSCVGIVGLWKFFDEAQPQLFYALLPEYTGVGYATEASRAVLKYALEALNVSYLDASFDTPNAKSRSVLERLGMQPLKDEIIDGKPISFFRFTPANGIIDS